MSQKSISLLLCLRIHWRLSTILKTSNKSVSNIDFWYVKVNIFWKIFQYTINWDKTKMLKKNFFGQNTCYKKMHSFFASSDSSVLLLICNFYAQGSLLQNWVWDFPFSIPPRFYYTWTLYFCSSKSMDPWTLKRHNFFQNKNNRKATRFCSQISDFKVATGSLEIQCASWSSPKTDLETNFLNLENRSLSMSHFLDINFLLNIWHSFTYSLFISFLNEFIFLIITVQKFQWSDWSSGVQLNC